MSLHGSPVEPHVPVQMMRMAACDFYVDESQFNNPIWCQPFKTSSADKGSVGVLTGETQEERRDSLPHASRTAASSSRICRIVLLARMADSAIHMCLGTRM
jgi:hypothetical protein